MNKFVQFLLGLCSFVWLIIGIGVLVGGIVLAIFITKTKPFEQLQQFVPFPSQGQSSGQSIEQLISNPEFQACAIRVLGEARVTALIRQKQLPSSSERVRLSVCFPPG